MVAISNSYFSTFPSFGVADGLGGNPLHQQAAAAELCQVATVMADPRTQMMARAGAMAAGAMMQHQLMSQMAASPFGGLLGGMSPFGAGNFFPQMVQQMLGQMLMAQALGNALQARGFGGAGCPCAGGGLGGGSLQALFDRLMAQSGQQQQQRGGGGFGGGFGGPTGGRAPAAGRTPSAGAPIGNAPGVPAPTGTGAGARALSLAQSQVGVREASGNNDGIPAQRYSGGRNEAWCANFVAWAFRQSGNQIPGNQRSLASARHLENTFKQQGKWFSPGQGTPQPGDVVWFPRSGGSGRHVGIVESVTNGRVNTIEGNSSNAVRRRSYPINSSRIVGYGRM